MKRVDEARSGNETAPRKQTVMEKSIMLALQTMMMSSLIYQQIDKRH